MPLDLELIFGYSLGEVLLQHRMTGSTLTHLLRSLFQDLVSLFYIHRPLQGERACQEASILARVLRRFQLMSASLDPDTRDWARLLTYDQLIVNDTPFTGWPRLHRWLVQDAQVAVALDNGPPELCHGDLIFDDIVVTPSSGHPPRGAFSARLIDPNGDAQSRFYDVGKITLSTWSYYELLKYDRFDARAVGQSVIRHAI